MAGFLRCKSYSIQLQLPNTGLNSIRISSRRQRLQIRGQTVHIWQYQRLHRAATRALAIAPVAVALDIRRDRMALLATPAAAKHQLNGSLRKNSNAELSKASALDAVKLAIKAQIAANTAPRRGHEATLMQSPTHRSSDRDPTIIWEYQKTDSPLVILRPPREAIYR